MNKLIIKEAEFLCHLGVTAQEKKKKQKIIVDIELMFDMRRAVQTDDIKDTIDYSDIYSLIINTINKREYKLIETLAENIARDILTNFDVSSARVRLRKPSALPKKAKYAAVEIMRSNG